MSSKRRKLHIVATERLPTSTATGPASSSNTMISPPAADHSESAETESNPVQQEDNNINMPALSH